MSEAKPGVRPVTPHFSSGPCAKRPGWSLQALTDAALGRSHRSKIGKAKLKRAIDLSREILQAPKVLVVAQPTWGVDVGAAAFIRQQLLDLSARGVAILVISEELEELFDICDRIAVLARGRLSPVRVTGDTNAEEIGRWMAGLFGGREEGAAPSPEEPAHA